MKKFCIVIFELMLMVGHCISFCRLEKKENFTQIANKFGYPVEEYDVVTQDGYILKLFHIPRDRSKPVLLMHGLLDSADTYIIRGNGSLASALADAGYDVWIGNIRGNRYSRRHLYLDPNTDIEFWDYSFHEFGYYDLPAIIDFVLDNTGADSLSAIGQSLGNAIFLVLGATRPDYNEKIKVMVSLSPICYLHNLKDAASYLLNSLPVLAQIFTLIGEEEVFGDDTVFVRLFRYICGCKESYDLCAYGFVFPLAGSDPQELEPEFFPTAIAHYPAGTSKKNGIHIYQISHRKTFAKFDYGMRNMEIYNSSEPPNYDLRQVTMKVALLAGRNDALSTLEDVELLRRQLPNVVYFTIFKHKRFNHADAVWGRNMRVYLFPSIFHVLSKYG